MNVANVTVEKISEMVEQLKAQLSKEKKPYAVHRGIYGHIAKAMVDLIMPIYNEKKASADIVRQSMGRVGSRQYAEAKARMPEVKHLTREESAELVDQMFIDPTSVDLGAQTDITLGRMLERLNEVRLHGMLRAYDRFVGVTPSL